MQDFWSGISRLLVGYSRPWASSATPTSRTIRSGSSGPTSTARGRIVHLVAFFGRNAHAATLTTYQIRQYQLARRAAGAATGTINRETSALHRMCTLAVHWGWLDTVPGFPDRLRENPPRQAFFEHPEYLAVRAHLPAPWQDILDLAYYSGWRKNEILGLTWDEIDEAGGVIRLSPARSKTLVGRILPISQPIAEAAARRRARRDPDSPLVFHRDGIPVRRWRTAWRTACQAAGVPTRFLHDCRRTAARNMIRASVAERVAMLLTGHKTRAIFDRYNIINEQELLEAGTSSWSIWRSTHRRRRAGARTRPARAPRRLSASCGAPPRKRARGTSGETGRSTLIMGYSADKSPLIGHSAGPTRRLEPSASAGVQVADERTPVSRVRRTAIICARLPSTGAASVRRLACGSIVDPLASARTWRLPLPSRTDRQLATLAGREPP